MGIIANHPNEKQFGMMTIQLVDYRNEISPYINDKDITECKDFLFEQVFQEVDKLPTANAKYLFLERYVLNFNDNLHLLSSLQKEYLAEINFKDRLRAKIERVKYELSHTTTEQIIAPKRLSNKLTFKPEIIPVIFEILKDFFDSEHQTELKAILVSGGNSLTPLLFRDNGNRLADAFKQLKNKDLIVGCTKKDIEQWLVLNFTFYYRGQIKSYTSDYVEKCISRDLTFPCKSPLFEIVGGKIEKKM